MIPVDAVATAAVDEQTCGRWLSIPFAGDGADCWRMIACVVATADHWVRRALLGTLTVWCGDHLIE